MTDKTPHDEFYPFRPSVASLTEAPGLQTAPALAGETSAGSRQRQAHAGRPGGALGSLDHRPQRAMDIQAFTHSPHVHWTVLEGEAVLLNLDNGVYYTLNRMGTVIWEFFIADQSFEDILTSVCERFAVTSEQAREDLEALVTRLHQEGLIVTKEE